MWNSAKANCNLWQPVIIIRNSLFRSRCTRSVDSSRDHEQVLIAGHSWAAERWWMRRADIAESHKYDINGDATTPSPGGVHRDDPSQEPTSDLSSPLFAPLVPRLIGGWASWLSPVEIGRYACRWCWMCACCCTCAPTSAPPGRGSRSRRPTGRRRRRFSRRLTPWTISRTARRRAPPRRCPPRRWPRPPRRMRRLGQTTAPESGSSPRRLLPTGPRPSLSTSRKTTHIIRRYSFVPLGLLLFHPLILTMTNDAV